MHRLALSVCFFAPLSPENGEIRFRSPNGSVSAPFPEGTEASYDASKLTEPAEVVLHEAVQKVGQAPTALADFVSAALSLIHI